MKAIELNLPDEVYQKLENLASQEHHSVNAFGSKGNSAKDPGKERLVLLDISLLQFFGD